MFFDLHNDFLWEGQSKTFKRAYLVKNKGIKIVCALWTTDKTFPLLDKIKQTINDFKAHENALFAIEDLHFITEQNLEALLNLPLSYCTLAWKYDNAIAGGHKGVGGITNLGMATIKALNNTNIAIDTAHLNKRSFYDVLKYGKRVLNSHTCQSAIFPHTRNLLDEQIKHLIQRDGLICLTSVGEFMTNGKADVNDFIYQLLRFIDKFGSSNLAIGTDFYGADPLKGLKDYEAFGFIRTELLKNGITAQDIDRIFFINAQNFFSKSEVKGSKNGI